MDMNVLVPFETVQGRQDYAAFEARVTSDNTRCIALGPSPPDAGLHRYYYTLGLT